MCFARLMFLMNLIVDIELECHWNNIFRGEIVSEYPDYMYYNKKSKRLVNERDELEVGCNKNLELRINKVVGDKMEKESNIQHK